MKHARWIDGQAFAQPIGKIVCVGRNYAAHARELGNAVPESPILFIKPNTAVVDLADRFQLGGRGENVHFETEVAVLIGRTLTAATEAEAVQAIAGLGLALDLTLRSVQTTLKDKGLPWELAKAFDGACPLSAFVPYAGQDLGSLQFALEVDGTRRQKGDSAAMLTPIPRLLSCMSLHFTLQPGDVVLTGTPAGVGELHRGARLRLSSSFLPELCCQVD